MTSHKPIYDAPLVTTLTGFVIIVAIPVSMYLLFSVWLDSLARQIVATSAICCMIGFLIIRNKYEASLLALLFFSQFQVSLHSFDLNQPVKLQILFCDVFITLFILVAIERRQPMRLDKMGWLFLTLICWFAVTTIFSAHLHQSLVFLFWQIKLLILYLLANNTKLSDSLVWRIVYVVLCVILIQGFIALLQLQTGGGLGLGILGEPSIRTFSYHNTVQGGLRVAGTLGAINGFAGYIAMFLVLLFPFVLIRKSLLLYSGFAFGFIALLLPLSRGGWLSFLLGCSCVVFMVMRARLVNFTRIVLCGSLVALILVGGIAIYFDKIMYRFQNKEAISSATGRIDQFYWVGDMIQKYPLVGIGPGISEFYGAWNSNRVFLRNDLSGVDIPNMPHNFELQVCLETGIPGLLILLAIIGVVLLSIFRKVDKESESESVICFRIGGTCAAVSVIVGASFDTLFSSYQIFLVFWVLLGLAWNRIGSGSRADRIIAG